jgi:hypothetical protein
MEFLDKFPDAGLESHRGGFASPAHELESAIELSGKNMQAASNHSNAMRDDFQSFDPS